MKGGIEDGATIDGLIFKVSKRALSQSEKAR